MTPTDATELLTAARRDPAALGRLLDEYRHYLRLLARIEIGRKLQGKVDASDVVQEAFIHAHHYFPNFRGESEAQLTAWLREILAGTLANQVRRYFGTKARDPRLEVGLMADLDHSTAGLGAIPMDPQTSPSQQVAKGEQSLLVASAIGQLPDDYQTVIVLRHMEGLTFPQVAERMGKSVDSVEKLWIRALAQLRKRITAV